MRITIDEQNAQALEDLTGKKLTKNGNAAIRQVIEMAENAENDNSIELSVCENTKKEMEQDA